MSETLTTPKEVRRAPHPGVAAIKALVDADAPLSALTTAARRWSGQSGQIWPAEYQLFHDVAPYDYQKVEQPDVPAIRKMVDDLLARDDLYAYPFQPGDRVVNLLGKSGELEPLGLYIVHCCDEGHSGSGAGQTWVRVITTERNADGMYPGYDPQRFMLQTTYDAIALARLRDGELHHTPATGWGTAAPSAEIMDRLIREGLFRVDPADPEHVFLVETHRDVKRAGFALSREGLFAQALRRAMDDRVTFSDIRTLEAEELAPSAIRYNLPRLVARLRVELGDTDR